MEIVNHNNNNPFLAQVYRTVELIHLYDNGIKQAAELEAPAYLIESKQRMKAQLVGELMALMAEMNVQFELKAAA